MALRCALRIALVTTLTLLLSPSVAHAHWCHDLWASSYNIVVKPVSDTVTVPAGGSAAVELYVQNNMGYALSDFSLEIEASGYQVESVVRQTPTFTNYLMPGEKLKYTFTVKKTSGTGDATLSVESLKFYVYFGGYASGYEGTRQDSLYSDNNPVMVRKAGGGLFPSTIEEVSAGGQSLHLPRSANADYYDLDGALAALSSQLQNGVPSDRSSVGYDALWAAGELAYRKSALTNINTLRTNLQKGWTTDADDASVTFRAFIGFVLGYLGDDAVAKTFLQGKAGSSNVDDQAIGKAALYLMTNGSSYATDLENGSYLSNLGVHVQGRMVTAAALGIVKGTAQDAVVKSELIDRARFTYFGSDHGHALLAAHLLNLVAWHRRGWDRDTGGTGKVSFYPDTGDTETPGGGGGGTGGGGGGGTGGGGGGGTGGGLGTTKSGCGYGTGGAAALGAAFLVLVALWRRK